MTDVPVIFSAPMTQALLAGHKSMTRRLSWWKKISTERKTGRFLGNKVVASPWRRVVVGDRLWAREAFCYHREKCKDSSTGFVEWIHYRATDEKDFVPGMKWRPSIHMPRTLSRLTLVVTTVKSELLQDISETDARAEGIVAFMSGPTSCFGVKVDGGYSPCGLTAKECFMNLFCDLHGPTIWRDNPEVVAVTFTVHKQNVDAMKEAA